MFLSKLVFCRDAAIAVSRSSWRPYLATFLLILWITFLEDVREVRWQQIWKQTPAVTLRKEADGSLLDPSASSVSSALESAADLD